MLDKYDKNKSPFKVPENYFEDLTKNVMNNLPQKEVKEVKKVQLWKKILPWTGVAAALVAIALSIGVFKGVPSDHAQGNNGKDEKVSYTTQQQLAYSEIQDYILFLEEEADEAEYVDMLLEE